MRFPPSSFGEEEEETSHFLSSELKHIMNALHSSYLKYSSPVSCVNTRFQLVLLLLHSGQKNRRNVSANIIENFVLIDF